MRKGTTPKLFFDLPFDTSAISRVRVVFAFNNEPILVKEEKACSFSGNRITISLTQEETFLFKCDTNYQVQVRVRLKGGDVISSDIMILPVERCLDKEVI